MSLIAWLVLGAIAGLFANALSRGKRGNRATDMGLGVAGALGGGFMFGSFGGLGLRSFNLYSVFVAGIGAVAALLTYHALFVYSGDDRD